MPSRRLFLATLLAASVMTGAADAQGKGQGGGNAGAGGNNGSAGGNGNAGGGGNPGGGNGNAHGGNGNAGGGGENAADNETNEEQEQSPVASELPGGSPGRIRLRHANGFEEEIGAGRYEMRDNRGRRIVSRAARLSDYARLRRLMAL